eukprot:463951_1
MSSLDKNGKITFDEFVTMMNRIMSSLDKNGDGKITLEELKDIMSSLDENGDGKITFDEFVTMMNRIMSSLDKNGDGKITLEELKDIMSSLDKNGDGKITFDELKEDTIFADMVASTAPDADGILGNYLNGMNNGMVDSGTNEYDYIGNGNGVKKLHGNRDVNMNNGMVD